MGINSSFSPSFDSSLFILQIYPKPWHLGRVPLPDPPGAGPGQGRRERLDGRDVAPPRPRPRALGLGSAGAHAAEANQQGWGGEVATLVHVSSWRTARSFGRSSDRLWTNAMDP